MNSREKGMAIEITCGNCGKHYKVDEKVRGQAGKCKAAGTMMEVPAIAAAPDPADDFGGIGFRDDPPAEVLGEAPVASPVSRTPLSPPPPPPPPLDREEFPWLRRCRDISSYRLPRRDLPRSRRCCTFTADVSAAGGVLASSAAEVRHELRHFTVIYCFGRCRRGAGLYRNTRDPSQRYCQPIAQTITCAQLYQNGYGNNAHVHVTGLKNMSRFVFYKRDNNSTDL